MDKTLIRVLDGTALHTIAGWDASLRAQRTGAYPWWQRGDIATPVMAGAGTLFACADTWAHDGVAPYLARNSLVFVDRVGQVWWLSADSSDAIPGDGVGRWFWPAGGIAAGDDAIVFGSVWETGGFFGTQIGPYCAAITGLDDAAPADPTPVAISGLSTSLAWGPPALFENTTVYMFGYNSSTFAQTLASHAYSDDAAAYSTGWSTTSVTFTSGMLGAPALIPWRGGWLASGKILSSAPGLGYSETPEVAAWWSEHPQGPYARLTNLHEDTTLTNWFSYGAMAQMLPRVGLVGMWSRNGSDSIPGWDVDNYGPVISPIRVPSWAETPS